MPWIIESYSGVNDLRFGMMPAEIEILLGKPDRSREGGPGVISEFRALHEPVVEYSTGKAEEFVFGSRTAEVMLHGIDLLDPDKAGVLRRLLAITPDLVEIDGGGIVSLQLGLAMSGFQDPDDSNKSVNAFARGAFDAIMRNPQPLRL